MAISTIGTDGLASSSVTSAKLASGAPSRAQLPAGTVLQVVNATNGVTYATSSTSFTSTGITASITPTSATSKIIALFSCAVYNNTNGGAVVIAVYRNAGEVGRCQSWYGASTVGGATGVIQVFDAPATTSSTTYTVYLKAASTGTAYLRPDDATPNVLTLMEIAA